MIRLVHADDAAACAAIYRPAVDGSWVSYEEIAPDAAVMRERIAASSTTYPWLVYAEGDDVLGYAYASKHRERAAYRWSVDVSIQLDERARGRGIGTALYRVLFRILQLQRFHRLYAGIALPNDASVALHLASGFTYVGIYTEVGFKAGFWGDVVWYERAIGTTSSVPPAEPIPLAQLDAVRLANALNEGAPGSP